MDSKKKFIKNRYWKTKYQPRNPEKVKNQQAVKTDEISSDSEEDFGHLKQPIPKEGWFPEEELLSSESDTEDLKTVQNYLKSKVDSEPDSDFEYEQACSNRFKGNIKYEDSKNLNENFETIKPIDNLKSKNSLSQNDSEDELNDLIFQLKDKSRLNVTKIEKKPIALSPEEKELDFLLSLKEPLHTGPIKHHKSFNNDRSLPTLKTKPISDEKNKTVDLEKWLDSVLDT